MGTKTIDLELDAYRKLNRARFSEQESFSSVVRRGRWERIRPATAEELVRRLERSIKTHPKMLLPEATLNAMARRHRTVRRKLRWDK